MKKQPMTQSQLKHLARLLENYIDKLLAEGESEGDVIHQVSRVKSWVEEDAAHYIPPEIKAKITL